MQSQVATIRMSEEYAKWGDLDFRDLNWVEPRYPLSNEEYGEETIARLQSLEGFNNYIGICGGGTQNLSLISLLSQKNELNEINLIDKNPAQLLNFSKLVNIYKKYPDNNAYLTAIKKHAMKNGNVEGLFVKTNKIRPELSDDLNIYLHQTDIKNHLKHTKSTGTYFIYLSNALFDPIIINNENSKKIINEIATNDVFENGTTLFMYYFSKSFILKKKDNAFHKI